MWLTALTTLRSEIFRLRKGGYIKEDEIETIQERKRSGTNNKKWKANNIDKSTMEVNIIFFSKLFSRL